MKNRGFSFAVRLVVAGFTAAGLSLLVNIEAAADDSPTRQLSQGKLVGFADEHNTYAWLGIPYAQPPVGDLRWKAPRPAQPWQGSKEAAEFGNYCTQVGSLVVTLNFFKWKKAAGSEDCLYLNIWAPRVESEAISQEGERLPVMLWIHGGGNAMGKADSYALAKLASSQKIIAVSINYRLGAFGWFTHPALRAQAENKRDASGNFAILDMIESLRWVKNNIEAFGGDPNNVTIFGESAGGFNVVSLLASPLAKGLFHRAIVQSGGADVLTLSDAENATDADQPGLPDSSTEILFKLLIADDKAADREAAKKAVAAMSDRQIADYFYSKSADDLFPLYEQMVMGMYNSPKMYRDGAVLPDMELIDWFKQPGAYNAVPTITGSNHDEFKLFLSSNKAMVDTTFGFIKKVIDEETFERHNRYRSDLWAASAVVDLADALSSSGADVWTYRFDWDEGADTWMGNAAQVYGAAHGLEIPFVLEQWQGISYPGIFTDDNEATRLILSKQMMDYWANFAYTGQPGKGRSGELTEWSAWKTEEADDSKEANNSEEAKKAPGETMIFDTASGGGVRMAANETNFARLKARLAKDKSITDAKERCQLYAQMFNHGAQFDQQEYDGLGCKDYPADSFAYF